MTIKQFPGKPKGGQFQSLLFSLILQPVRINKPGAPLLGLKEELLGYLFLLPVGLVKIKGFELSAFWCFRLLLN